VNARLLSSFIDTYDSYVSVSSRARYVRVPVYMLTHTKKYGYGKKLIIMLMQRVLRYCEKFK
jgi:hypothetical protein